MREFYVGYLSMPPRLKWIVRGLVVLLLGLIAADAWLVATMQPPAGNGTWSEAPQEYIGTLTRTPYPYPRLEIKRRPPTIFDYAYEDFEVLEYQHHAAIKAPVAV